MLEFLVNSGKLFYENLASTKGVEFVDIWSNYFSHLYQPVDYAYYFGKLKVLSI